MLLSLIYVHLNIKSTNKMSTKTIPLKHVALMGKQMIKAKQILALGKIIGMKAKYFAEQRDNVHMQDLDYVLEKMKELETFLK